jgi:hypothetical protein
MIDDDNGVSRYLQVRTGPSSVNADTASAHSEATGLGKPGVARVTSSAHAVESRWIGFIQRGLEL